MVMSTLESVSPAKEAAPKPRKFRSACDNCHRSKTRCSGGNPCSRCQEFVTKCTYSYSVRAGKPKGSRCRKTLEREQRAALAAEESQSDSASKREEHAIPPEGDANTHSAPSTSASMLSSPLPTSEPFCGHTEFPFSQTTSENIPCSGWFGPSAVDWLQSTEGTLPDAIDLNSSTNAISCGEQMDGTNWFNFESLSDHDLCLDFPGLHPSVEEHTPVFQPLPSRPKHAEGECNCLATLSTLVSRQIAARDVLRYDASLVLIRDAARACICFCRCGCCPKDAGSISLVVTTLQLMTGTVDRLIQHLQRRSASESSNDLDLSNGPVRSGSEENTRITPGTEGGPIQVQLGVYHTSHEDGHEQIQILSMLVRSGVRRMLEVCWPMWDLLRSLPCSLPSPPLDGRMSPQPHKMAEGEYNATSLNHSEVSQVRNTRLASNPLCYLYLSIFWIYDEYIDDGYDTLLSQGPSDRFRHQTTSDPCLRCIETDHFRIVRRLTAITMKDFRPPKLGRCNDVQFYFLLKPLPTFP
uniref:C6 transcription factor n=1 Tax=Penicillium lilacinoechinulatum TaxID=451136 RepID=A9Q1F8_9EURO|nr:C6 transcription factor [Penicillium lilacinoechinulatum]